MQFDFGPVSGNAGGLIFCWDPAAIIVEETLKDLRFSKTEITGFFSKNIGLGFSFEAEVFSILEALNLCHQYVIHNIIIESVSTLVVKWVNHNNDMPWKLRNVLNEIDILISSADKFAKRGSNKLNDLYFLNISM